MGCGTCGSQEFRATLISNLNCYKNNPEVSKSEKYSKGNLISPIYYKLDDSDVSALTLRYAHQF